MFHNLISLIATAPAHCSKGDFFGLRPWYHYLEASSFDGCDIKKFRLLPRSGSQSSDVPLVLLAIVDDLLRIAGIVAVAFIIVGAVQYVTSEGNPEKTSRAQSTIVNALIGAAIAIMAVAFISFLGNRLGG